MAYHIIDNRPEHKLIDFYTHCSAAINDDGACDYGYAADEHFTATYYRPANDAAAAKHADPTRDSSADNGRGPGA